MTHTQNLRPLDNKGTSFSILNHERSKSNRMNEGMDTTTEMIIFRIPIKKNLSRGENIWIKFDQKSYSSTSYSSSSSVISLIPREVLSSLSALFL